MLVLSRRIGEWVNLRHSVTGELIRICVADIRQNGARLGFEASRDWNIVREELDQRIQARESDLYDLGRRPQ